MNDLPAPGDFGRVVVLYGGCSAEREISLNSGQAVYDGLVAAGVDAHLLDTGTDGWSSSLSAQHYDRAFIVLHGRGGEDGQIQALLDVIGIPYTGSSMAACALAMDKLWSKAVWRSAGLPVLSDMQVTAGDCYEDVAACLGTSVFVIKPALEGSSVGVSKVSTAQDFQKAYALAGGDGEKIMAEPWVNGRELTYAILGDDVLPSIEIIASKAHAFYDYEAKYLVQDTNYICPASIDAGLDEQLRHTALAAFQAVGASGWGRVDYLLDERNQAHLLEINLIPGMTSHSLVPLAARTAGIDFSALTMRILADSLSIQEKVL